MWWLISLILGLIAFLFKLFCKITGDVTRLNIGVLLNCMFLGSLIVTPLMLFADGRFWWYVLAGANAITFFALGWYGRKGNDEWRNRPPSAIRTQRKIRVAWGLSFILNNAILLPIVIFFSLSSMLGSALPLIMIYVPNEIYIAGEEINLIDQLQNTSTLREEMFGEAGLSPDEITNISRILTGVFLTILLAAIILFIVDMSYERKYTRIELDPQSQTSKGVTKSYIALFFAIALSAFTLLFVRGRELYEAFFNLDELSITIFVIAVLAIIIAAVLGVFGNVIKLIKR